MNVIFERFQICDSECESGSDTEEMDLPPEEEEFAEEDEDSTNQEDKSDEAVNGAKSLLPSETVDRQDSVEKWNLRNETEVIGECPHSYLNLFPISYHYSVRP